MNHFCFCGTPIVELKESTVYTTIYSKKLYLIGGESILACLKCGHIEYDPTRTERYKTKTNTT